MPRRCLARNSSRLSIRLELHLSQKPVSSSARIRPGVSLLTSVSRKACCRVRRAERLLFYPYSMRRELSRTCSTPALRQPAGHPGGRVPDEQDGGAPSASCCLAPLRYPRTTNRSCARSCIPRHRRQGHRREVHAVRSPAITDDCCDIKKFSLWQDRSDSTINGDSNVRSTRTRNQGLKRKISDGAFSVKKSCAAWTPSWSSPRGLELLHVAQEPD